jgi:hypothetical protein
MDEQLAQLRASIHLACDSQSMRCIDAGRKEVLAMRRDWVLQNFESAARDAVDFNDEWHYRRLLELATQLGDHLLFRRLVFAGLGSENPEVVEAAQDSSASAP